MERLHRKGQKRAGTMCMEMAVAAPWALHVFVSCHLKVLAIYWAAWLKKGP